MTKYWWHEEQQAKIKKRNRICKAMFIFVIICLVMYTGYVLGYGKAMERLDKYLDIKWEIWEQAGGEK